MGTSLWVWRYPACGAVADVAKVRRVPVALYHPGRGFGRVTSVCPTPELGPGEGVEAGIHGLAHAGAVVVCPTPDDGVELTDHLALGQGPGAANDPSELREMLQDV